MDRNEFIKKLYETPQIYEDFGTISYQMKLDIYDKFIGKNLNCIEMGCYKGYTTDLLSNVFNNVLGLEYNTECLEYAKNHNKNNKNTKFERVDLYNQSEVDNIVNNYKDVYQVAFIDALHNYKSVMSDMKNALKMGCKYIILDDVGVYDELKIAVNDFVQEYKDDIVSMKNMGIDWKHYKLPILNLPIINVRIQEINLGYSNYEFTWLLRDKTDIEINSGETFRPMFNPMNVNIQIVRNYTKMVSGHFYNELKKENSENLIDVFCSIEDWPYFPNDNSKVKPSHKFVAIPMHRFNTEVFESLLVDDVLFSENDVDYEGILIELK